jgi:hypothetical protein
VKATANAPASQGENNPSIEERLTKLADLKVKGLIGEEEYTALTKKILDEG